MRVARVELGEFLVDAPASDVTRVVVSCDGVTANLRVDDPITGKALERRLDISSLPIPSRARGIGLAVAELVLASWVELELSPTQTSPDATATAQSRHAAAEVVRRHAPDERRDAVRQPVRVVAMLGQGWLSSGVTMRSASARFAYRRGALGLHFDTDLAQGTQNVSLGEINTLTIAGGPRVTGAIRIDGLSLEAGVGLLAGAARLSGMSAENINAAESSFWAPWAAWQVTLEARAAATRRLSLVAGLTAGDVFVAVNARVAEVEVPTIDGRLLGARVGVEVTIW